MVGGKGDASGASPRKGPSPSQKGRQEEGEAGKRGGRKKPAGAQEGGRGQGAAPRKQLDSLSHLQTKSSAFRGVSWSKHKQKWQSCIRIANRQFFLGRYADECEAARAYDRAAICYYSAEAARTNFAVGQYEAELGTLQRMDIQLYAATSQQHSRALTSHLRRAAQVAGKAAQAAGGVGSPGAGTSPSTARKKKMAEGGAAAGMPPLGAAVGAYAAGAGTGVTGDGGGAAALPGVGSPSDFLAAAEERLRRQGQQGSSPGSAGAAGAGLSKGGTGAGASPGAGKQNAKARTPKAKVKAGGVAKGGAGPKRAPSKKAAAKKKAEAVAALAAAAGSFSAPRPPMAAVGGAPLGPPGMGALWDPLVPQGGGLHGVHPPKAVRAGPPGSDLFPHSAPPLPGLPGPPSLDDLSDDTRHLDPSEELHNLNSLFSGVMFQTGREQGDLREKQFDVLAGQDAVLGLQGGVRTELESVLRAEADALALRDQLELQYRHNMQLWESSLLEFESEVSPSGAAPGQPPPMHM